MPLNEKLILYQVFPRILTNNNQNCRRFGTLAQNGSGKLEEITDTVLKSIKELGVNAVWYTGVLEMATKTDFTKYGIAKDNDHIVKGEAGSPYAIKDYYDVDPSLAVDVDRRVEEFEALIQRTHDNSMKVILDFVPNHTARCYVSDKSPKGVEPFGASDDTTMSFKPGNDYYYITNQQFQPSIDITSGADPYWEFPAKVTGNDCFTAFPTANDWYETVKLNYGRDYANWSNHFSPMPPLWNKMLSILRYWCAKGVDGFRCDMVFMVPVEFWNWVIPMVKKDYPEVIFIGEIYDVGQYRTFLSYGHFDYLYDKVNLYDTIVGIERYNYSAARLTECWQAVDGIGDSMLNFLENHDEVRYGSKSFAGNPALVESSLVVSSMMSKGPFLIYYGQEIGESARDNEGFAGDNDRTTIFDYWSYASLRRWYADGKCDGSLLKPQEKWLRSLYSTVLKLCNSEKAISQGSFFDLMYVNLHNPNFNPHRVFAFLRNFEDETLLIVANFNGSDLKLGINVPDAAFEMLRLPWLENARFKDLMTGEVFETPLLPDRQVAVTVRGRRALVLKLQLERNKPSCETISKKVSCDGKTDNTSEKDQ